MTRAVTIEDLLNDHASLRAHAAALVSAVRELRPDNMAKVQDLRWALTRVAHQHLVLDERYVQVPLESRPDPSVRGKAAELRADAERFRSYWTLHIADWPSERVASSWTSYRRAVHRLVDRMEERLDREERELYPLVGPSELAKAQSADRNWAAEALRLRSSFYS